MDPTACLALLIAAALDGDADALEAHAADLVEWLRSGGFTPRLTVNRRVSEHRRLRSDPRPDLAGPHPKGRTTHETEHAPMEMPDVPRRAKLPRHNGGPAMRTRAKGVRFEAEVAREFERAGFHVRGLEAGGDHLCVSALEGTAALSPRVLHVECKRQERLKLPEWIRQAERDAAGLAWLVVFRQNRGVPYVVQPLAQYLGASDA